MLSRYIPLYPAVSHCIPLYTVSRCIPLYPAVSRCIPHIPLYPTVFRCIPLYPAVSCSIPHTQIPHIPPYLGPHDKMKNRDSRARARVVEAVAVEGGEKAKKKEAAPGTVERRKAGRE